VTDRSSSIISMWIGGSVSTDSVHRVSANLLSVSHTHT